MMRWQWHQLDRMQGHAKLCRRGGRRLGSIVVVRPPLIDVIDAVSLAVGISMEHIGP